MEELEYQGDVCLNMRSYGVIFISQRSESGSFHSSHPLRANYEGIEVIYLQLMASDQQVKVIVKRMNQEERKNSIHEFQQASFLICFHRDHSITFEDGQASVKLKWRYPQMKSEIFLFAIRHPDN